MIHNESHRALQPSRNREAMYGKRRCGSQVLCLSKPPIEKERTVEKHRRRRQKERGGRGEKEEEESLRCCNGQSNNRTYLTKNTRVILGLIGNYQLIKKAGAPIPATLARAAARLADSFYRKFASHEHYRVVIRRDVRNNILHQRTAARVP